MMRAQSILRWLLNQPDSERLGRLINLVAIRKELSKQMWDPASPDGLNDEEIEESYRSLCTYGKSLRNGEARAISGYLIRVPIAGEVTIRPAFQRTSANRYEIILLCAILTAKALLRRCKKCKEDPPVLFVKRKRKEYCSKKCSGLARIRKHRSKNTAKRVATGSQP